MKFVILIAVVLFVLWLMRGKRSSDARDASPPAQAKVAPPQDMVECPVCSLHLPRTDALPGPDGQLYCCAEHRQRAGA